MESAHRVSFQEMEDFLGFPLHIKDVVWAIAFLPDICDNQDFEDWFININLSEEEYHVTFKD